ncbi:hypothetical protein AB0J84_31465 [Micromonospora arborensis]|uniref:hypothetical protein n=1 Tax=Micromonospora arborensis TaxID=2116518 RepID=UPI0034348AA5
MPYQDHRCQPFTGAAGPDIALQVTFQRDPFCWSPALGFHRSSKPLRRIGVTLHRGPKKHVYGNALSRTQLVRLGAGAGLSNGGSLPVPENVWRLVEVSDGTGPGLYAKGWLDYPDAAESFARLGADMRHMVDSGAADFLSDNPDAARQWVGEALFRPLVTHPHPALYPARDLLIRATGGPMSPESLAEIGKAEDAAYKSRTMWDTRKGDQWLTYNAAALVRIAQGPDPFGAVRVLCRLVAVTEPTPAETVQWWRRVIGEAVHLAAG